MIGTFTNMCWNTHACNHERTRKHTLPGACSFRNWFFETEIVALVQVFFHYDDSFTHTFFACNANVGRHFDAVSMVTSTALRFFLFFISLTSLSQKVIFNTSLGHFYQLYGQEMFGLWPNLTSDEVRQNTNDRLLRVLEIHLCVIKKQFKYPRNKMTPLAGKAIPKSVV